MKGENEGEGWHLGEPDGGVIVKDGSHDGLIYVATNVSVVKPQLDPAKAFMTLRAHEARSTQLRA